MSNHVVPVALPGPEENAPPKPGVAGTPDVGPVVPLAAAGGGEAGDLLGANGRPAQATPDPVAAKVLSRGDAIAAPAGRADDFSWPRPGMRRTPTPDVAPQPVALTPARAGEKGRCRCRRDAKQSARRAPAKDAKPTPRPVSANADQVADRRRRRFSAAAASIPSGTCRPRARPGGLRGSPRPPATGRGACRRRRTPCRSRCGNRRSRR